MTENQEKGHDSSQSKDGSQASEEQSNKPAFSRFGFSWFAILILLGFLFWGLYSEGLNRHVEIPYSTFRQHVKDGEVTKVVFTGNKIEGKLSSPAKKALGEDGKGEPTEYRQFVTRVPEPGDEKVTQLLLDQGVVVNTKQQSNFPIGLVLANLIPFLLLFWIGYMVITQMRSQGQNIFSVGKSNAKLYERKKEPVTFDDVAGVEGAITELREIVTILEHRERFQHLGAKTPKGVMLVGPPGTGKTLLARAVAGEAGVPFFSISGSDFMQMFVGVGASRVRDLFQEAKKRGSGIIFIDEIDSIGRQRGAGLGGGHDEREQTLNQLLSELDGFEPTENIIVMAATNRPDVLDPALLRPGRFSRQISINLPTRQGRLDILKIKAKDKPLGEDVSLEEVARRMPGASGADLENLLNEAAMVAARENQRTISRAHIEQAQDRIFMGMRRDSLVMTEDETRLVAYHESGHAMLGVMLPNTDPVYKVSIVPRERSMGITQQVPEREMYVYPRDYIVDRVAVMMGGRAAEEIVFGTATSGAENDLKEATRLARRMVLDWGMNEQLGHMALNSREEDVFLGREMAQRREYSEATAREADEDIRAILHRAFERATQTLQDNRQELDRLAEALIEKEELLSEEVLRVLGVEKQDKQLVPQMSHGG